MSGKSDKIKTDRENDNKNYSKKLSRKQEVIRPSSIIPATRGLGRHHRAASVSTTSYVLERNALEKENIQTSIIKNGDLDLRQSRGRKTRRANSLPTSNTKKYSFEANVRQTSSKKVSQGSREKKRDIEWKRIYQQRMSLDLSQMSDFADSEGESRDKFSKHSSRRRRSAEKAGRPERISSHMAVRSMSNSPSSKITSCSQKTITRRSSLQNFNPRSCGSFENVPQNNISGRDCFRQGVRRRTSSAMLFRKSSLGSSLIRNSEFLFSSESPDYTSDPSPVEFSPWKRPSTIIPIPRKKQNESLMFDTASSRTTQSSSYLPSSTGRKEGDKSTNGNATTPGKERGEWNSFWQNYNSSLAALPKKFFYDDCPTPFYEPKTNGDFKAFEINCKQPDPSREEVNQNGQSKVKKSSNYSGVFLSNSEAKEIIYCAQKLAEIITSVLERGTVKKQEKEIKNKAKAPETEKQENKVVGETSKDVFL